MPRSSLTSTRIRLPPGVAVLLLLSLAACAAPTHEDLAPTAEPVVREATLMGTRAQLRTYAGTRAEGLARLEAALDVLESSERELSTWMDESHISRLNRAPVGEPWLADGRTCDLLSDLTTLVAVTGGAFDPAIGRLIDAWDIHGAGRVPGDDELAEARGRSGWRRLVFTPETCTVVRDADVTIDVGAFGKGEALDRVERAGLRGSWLIDLGGQVSAVGTPPGSPRWPVALAHPLDRAREVLALEIPSGSLATSAGSERDLLVEGERVGHILDPRTGLPAPFTGSVSVWHTSGLYADALSTALFVMGPDMGLAWAEAEDLAAVYLIPDSDGLRVMPSTAFQPLIVDRRAASTLSWRLPAERRSASEGWRARTPPSPWTGSYFRRSLNRRSYSSRSMSPRAYRRFRIVSGDSPRGPSPPPTPARATAQTRSNRTPSPMSGHSHIPPM